MKTADNKIPVSSVFNDTRRTVQNDCLPLPCSKASLFHAAKCVSGHVVRASFFLRRHRNALTEMAWDTEQGLGMAMSTVASDKTGNCC